VKHVRRWRTAVTAGTATLLVVGGSVVAAVSASASVGPGNVRAAIAGSQTSLASSKALLPAAPALPAHITASVYLASSNAAGLTAYAQDVSTPGNALYGHYLSAATSIARYAPSASEAANVEGWARSSGLSVGDVTRGFGAYVQVTGTPAQVEHAFGVKFGSYRVTSKKSVQKFWAPEESASVPTSISGDVLTVSGLDNVSDQMKPDDTLPPPGQNYEVAPYTSDYYGQKTTTGKYGKVYGSNTTIPTVNGKPQPWTNFGYTSDQIRGAYNVTGSRETGKGVTVAIIDAYVPPALKTGPALESDTDSFTRWEVTQRGGNPRLDKPFAKGQYQQVLHPGASGWDDTAADECGASGWYGESTLDVESVHGMAPDAHVVYVGASDCTDTGLGNAIAYVVNTHAASIVTDSWGEPSDTSSLTPAYEYMFKGAATEGIGFFFSSGDDAYEDPNYQDGGSDQVQVDYPTSSPWVTSVGGTSLAIGSRGNYQFSTGWGTILDPLATTSTGAGSWELAPTDTADEILNGGWDGGGGGGVATGYAQPWYQQGIVPTQLATTEVKSTPIVYNTHSKYGDVILGFNESTVTASSPRRVIPDVSALADPSTGTAVGETLYGPDNAKGKAAPLEFRISRIGGTSLASPTFAGIEADAQQAFGRAIGFANPAIYKLDARNGFSQAFHGVTDTVGGAPQYEVRSNYPGTGDNIVYPLNTYLRRLGVDGFNGVLDVPATPATKTSPKLPAFQLKLDDLLSATPGYNDSTGVGSPDLYIQAFKNHHRF
jgi:subtilase family serine protease